MFNFIKVVIPNARQCFIKLEHRIHLCSTLKVPNKTAPAVESETIKESYEFDIFEISRVHAHPFQSIKPIILNDIKILNKTLNEPLVNNRFAEIMEQDKVLSWVNIRPLMIIGICEALAKSRGHTITDEEMFDIYRFAWLYQMFETHEIMLDDIYDNQVLRRGNPTWWYKNNKNPVGIYDSWMPLNFCRILLYKYYKDKFYYNNIQKMMNETITSYLWGQALSTLTENTEFLKTITTEGFHHLIAHRNEMEYHVPMVFGLHINGLYDEKDAEKIYKICRLAGAKVQCWDDFLDRERDLEAGRNSWLAVLALDKANESQKNILLNNSGKKDEKNIAAILKLYEEMDMKTLVHDQRKKLQLAVEIEAQTIKNQAIGKILINLIKNDIEHVDKPAIKPL